MRHLLFFLFLYPFCMAQDGSNVQWENIPYTADAFAGMEGTNTALQNDGVYCIAEQPDGKILLGGKFLTYNGIISHCIVRLNADGTVDAGFSSPVTMVEGSEVGTVRNIMVLEDERIAITGEFYTCGNQSCGKGFLILDKYGAILNDGDALNPGKCTASCLLADGRILVAASPAGNSTKALTMLNSDGTIDTGFAVLSSILPYQIESIAQQNSGKIVIAGKFNYLGNSAKNLLRINLDGTLDTSFNNQNFVDDKVRTVRILDDDKILIGGDFNHYDGILQQKLAKLTEDGDLDASFDTEPGIYPVNGIDVQEDGKIIIATDYSPVNIHLATRLNPDGSYDDTYYNNPLAVWDMRVAKVLSDGQLMFGGSSETFLGTGRKFVWKLFGDGTFDASFNACIGANHDVWAAAKQADGKIVITGRFCEYSGTTRYGIARILPNGEIDPDFDTGTTFINSWIYDVKLQPDGKILVGGNFEGAFGQHNALLRLNPDGSPDTGFQGNFTAGSVVMAIAVQPDGKILLGGNIPDSKMRLNSDGSDDTGFDPGIFPLDIKSIFPQADGRILYTGSFTEAGGETHFRIARVNNDGSLDSTFNPGGQNTLMGMSVYCALTRPDGKILVGGSCHEYENEDIGKIFLLNENGSLNHSFASEIEFDEVRTIELLPNGKVIAAGSFNDVNGHPTQRIARLNSDGSTDTAFICENVNGSYVNASLITNDGNLFVTGDFSEFNGYHRGRVNLVALSDIPASAERPANAEMSLYPNPTRGIVFINSPFQIEAIEIIALDGKALQMQPALLGNNTFDISALTAGVYIIKAKSGDTIYSSKIVKQ